MGAMFSFFQSPGTSPDCHDLSNIMENGLATPSIKVVDMALQDMV